MSCVDIICGTLISVFLCAACRDCCQYQRLRDPIYNYEEREAPVQAIEIEMVPVTTDMIRLQNDLKVVVLTDDDRIN